MISAETKKSVINFYGAVKANWTGFKAREGQMQMVGQVASVLANAKPEGATRDGTNIGVIQGQTGVGKTFGYDVPAVMVGKALTKRVLISTATVALQEQLFARDLPALQKISPIPFTFALAKRRGHYACNIKLKVLCGNVAQNSMFEDATWERPPAEAKLQTLKTITIKLLKNEWDGDKDSLTEDVDTDLWSKIGADRHSCLGRNCPRFSACSYYKARKELVAADVIVANHDLVLAALASESKLLPEPEVTLYMFDEGHHLPEAAISRFASSNGLSASVKWLDKLDLTLRKCSTLLPSSDSHSDMGDKIDALVEHLRRL